MIKFRLLGSMVWITIRRQNSGKNVSYHTFRLWLLVVVQGNIGRSALRFILICKVKKFFEALFDPIKSKRMLDNVV